MEKANIFFTRKELIDIKNSGKGMRYLGQRIVERLKQQEAWKSEKTGLKIKFGEITVFTELENGDKMFTVKYEFGEKIK